MMFTMKMDVVGKIVDWMNPMMLDNRNYPRDLRIEEI